MSSASYEFLVRKSAMSSNSSDAGGSSSSSSQGVAATKSQPKSKRKISLPWFRQGSVAKAHPALTRQHTIDTPSSFQARLLRSQPSQSALVIIFFISILFTGLRFFTDLYEEILIDS